MIGRRTLANEGASVAEMRTNARRAVLPVCKIRGAAIKCQSKCTPVFYLVRYTFDARGGPFSEHFYNGSAFLVRRAGGLAATFAVVGGDPPPETLFFYGGSRLNGGRRITEIDAALFSSVSCRSLYTVLWRVLPCAFSALTPAAAGTALSQRLCWPAMGRGRGRPAGTGRAQASAQYAAWNGFRPASATSHAYKRPRRCRGGGRAGVAVGRALAVREQDAVPDAAAGFGSVHGRAAAAVDRVGRTAARLGASERAQATRRKAQRLGAAFEPYVKLERSSTFEFALCRGAGIGVFATTTLLPFRARREAGRTFLTAKAVAADVGREQFSNYSWRNAAGSPSTLVNLLGPAAAINSSCAKCAHFGLSQGTDASGERIVFAKALERPIFAGEQVFVFYGEQGSFTGPDPEEASPSVVLCRRSLAGDGAAQTARAKRRRVSTVAGAERLVVQQPCGAGLCDADDLDVYIGRKLEEFEASQQREDTAGLTDDSAWEEGDE